MGFHRAGWRSFIRYDEDQDRPDVSWQLVRRVAGWARPYWDRILLLLALIIVTSLLGLVPPLLYRDLLDNAIPNRDVARLNLLALGVVAVPLLSGLISLAQGYLSSSVGEGLICDLRRAVYAHLQRMSMRFFTHTKTGEVMSRLTNDVGGAQRAVTGTSITLVTNLISIASTLAIMISMEWRLTALGVAILPLFILSSRRVGTVLRRITREHMELRAEMNALMNETLNVSGALLVKIFGRGADEVDRFRGRATAVRDISVRRSLVGRWFRLGMSLVGAVGTALVFWVGGHLVLRGAFTIGTIVAFSTYLTRLYGPLTALTNARVEFATSLVSFERVFEVLDLPVEIQDRPDAVVIDDAMGHVRFEDVSFSYVGDGKDGTPVGLEEVRRFSRHGTTMPSRLSGRGRGDGRSRPTSTAPSGDGQGDSDSILSPPNGQPSWALRDVSFEIQPGQLAALVGPSGAGKTTITYLLPRLYDSTEGRITLDGIDLRHIELVSLAGNMGMVTQETYLFHDTIRENLLYADPSARQAQLEDACRAANIHDFIMGLPESYETVVGERGYRLSGGEKQRVAIARVILKDPRVLILDEATSHLDSESEALIQHALEGVMKGRTSLVIAHRLSTILSADLILVMDEGQLVEQGTHAELLAQGGTYAGLYHAQFWGSEEAMQPAVGANERQNPPGSGRRQAL